MNISTEIFYLCFRLFAMVKIRNAKIVIFTRPSVHSHALKYHFCYLFPLKSAHRCRFRSFVQRQLKLYAPYVTLVEYLEHLKIRKQVHLCSLKCHTLQTLGNANVKNKVFFFLTFSGGAKGDVRKNKCAIAKRAL